MQSFRISTILAVFALAGILYGQQEYWSPANPPKSDYHIDASIDLKNGLLKGSGSVALKNNSSMPMEVIAVDWRLSESYSLSIRCGSRELEVINQDPKGHAVSPLFYRLPYPLEPGRHIDINTTFAFSFELDENNTQFGTTKWFPRLWWNGLPLHDAFSVKLAVPKEYAVAASGRLNTKTGRYEVEGARTFGFHIGRELKAVTREVAGVQVTTLATEKGSACAAACMATALDAIAWYKEWLGLFPFDFLYIIPGGSGRWGGYPFATGIVVIHGQETFKPDEKTTHWKRITAHEIGHEYWGGMGTRFG